jgi:hypothetical protein
VFAWFRGRIWDLRGAKQEGKVERSLYPLTNRTSITYFFVSDLDTAISEKEVCFCFK